MSVEWNDLESLETFDVETEKAKGNNLLLIDGLNLCFRYKHQNYKVPSGVPLDMLDRPEDFSDEYRETILSLARSYSASKIIIAADKGSSSFRKEIYPEYKANRDYSDQSDEEKQMFFWFIEDYEHALESAADIATVLRYERVEADDIIAYICQEHVDKYDNIWIVSSDGDLDLLINEKVSRFNWATQKHWKTLDKSRRRPKEITLENWNDHHQGTPEQYLSYKVLEGDSGDGIPGVYGVGPAYAKRLIDKYGSIQDIITKAPIPGSAKYIQNLNESMNQLATNVALMDLVSYHRQAIGEENIQDIESRL